MQYLILEFERTEVMVNSRSFAWHWDIFFFSLSISLSILQNLILLGPLLNWRWWLILLTGYTVGC